MTLREELMSAGVLPSGPVSGWPKERHEALEEKYRDQLMPKPQNPVNFPSAGQMAKGLIKTVGQAVTNGSVSKEIREERYDTCKACPAFDASSERCKKCGCFMKAKTWVGGNPEKLCPLNKWKR